MMNYILYVAIVLSILLPAKFKVLWNQLKKFLE